ncbi:MAG: T9SS type A sorting domain-containing protein, partial [Candidatus Latescibacteria bacterium]|nr:T9SS type A sorting domain-containing protein [Candidatus Latescibacterota bacterium]
DGAATELNTQAKMLWDDTYLYIAYICEDPYVTGTYKNHDDPLYKEEVVEFFVDPDGDGLNYIELEFSPNAVILDYFMNKTYSDGGKADTGWTMAGLKVATGIDGTLNDASDTDVKWVCECAIPFDQMEFTAPTMNFPPADSDTWRLNLYRYDYGPAAHEVNELSGWNQTDKRGFHAPDKFGRVIFSEEPVVNPTAVEGAIPYSFGITGNYPNPFNPSTRIEFAVPFNGSVIIDVYNILGQHVRSLFSDIRSAGNYSVIWDGHNTAGEMATSGIYFVTLKQDSQVTTRRMLLMK